LIVICKFKDRNFEICFKKIVFPLYIWTFARLIWFDFWCFNTTFSNISVISMATSFSGGRSRREPPTMSKQLVHSICLLVKLGNANKVGKSSTKWANILVYF
jgi:hypothetical protein